jgi:hypothetical protein
MHFLWLIAAFALFMAAIWSVYALNGLAQARYGYQPFSLPNAALMLVVNLLLLSALREGAEGDGGALTGLVSAWAPAVSIKLAAGALLSAVVLVVITRRTRLWIALYAVLLMAAGAIAILPSLIFRSMAVGGDDQA